MPHEEAIVDITPHSKPVKFPPTQPHPARAPAYLPRTPSRWIPFWAAHPATSQPDLTLPVLFAVDPAQVEALLDRHQGGPPVMQYVVRQFRELGYGSVAWRVVNSAGEAERSMRQAALGKEQGLEVGQGLLGGFGVRVGCW